MFTWWICSLSDWINPILVPSISLRNSTYRKRLRWNASTVAKTVQQNICWRLNRARKILISQSKILLMDSEPSPEMILWRRWKIVFLVSYVHVLVTQVSLAWKTTDFTLTPDNLSLLMLIVKVPSVHTFVDLQLRLAIITEILLYSRASNELITPHASSRVCNQLEFTTNVCWSDPSLLFSYFTAGYFIRLTQ